MDGGKVWALSLGVCVGSFRFSPREGLFDYWQCQVAVFSRLYSRTQRTRSWYSQFYRTVNRVQLLETHLWFNWPHHYTTLCSRFGCYTIGAQSTLRILKASGFIVTLFDKFLLKIMSISYLSLQEIWLIGILFAYLWRFWFFMVNL